jgi:hypothetical protein
MPDTPATPSFPGFVTAEDFIEGLPRRRSLTTIRRWCAAGLPHARIGSVLLIHTAGARRFLERRIRGEMAQRHAGRRKAASATPEITA